MSSTLLDYCDRQGYLTLLPTDFCKRLPYSDVSIIDIYSD